MTRSASASLALAAVALATADDAAVLKLLYESASGEETARERLTRRAHSGAPPSCDCEGCEGSLLAGAVRMCESERRGRAAEAGRGGMAR